MEKIKLISWNVNGLRAVYKKGFLEWFARESPDMLCLQETKASPEQLPPELLEVPGYRAYFSSAARRGYSGVGLYTKTEPLRIEHGIGIEDFDTEGRAVIAEYPWFVLCSVYFPNGKASKERLAYKMSFYEAFLSYIHTLKRQKKNIVVCGDVNTAHREIDLARPRENESVSGFLPEERAWIDRLLEHGYVDTFRMFCEDPEHYTWWDYKTRARSRNVGWRLDYFFVDEAFSRRVTRASILSDVTGSDHCPVGLEISV